MNVLRRAKRCDHGSVAVEFALVFPPLVMLTVGTLYIGLVMYTASGLHNAVEAAARCYSVNSSQCSTAAATQLYAKAHYYGTGSPTFIASATFCGHKVGGTMSVVFSAGLTSWTIPLSATACFP